MINIIDSRAATQLIIILLSIDIIKIAISIGLIWLHLRVSWHHHWLAWQRMLHGLHLLGLNRAILILGLNLADEDLLVISFFEHLIS